MNFCQKCTHLKRERFGGHFLCKRYGRQIKKINKPRNCTCFEKVVEVER